MNFDLNESFPISDDESVEEIHNEEFGEDSESDYSKIAKDTEPFKGMEFNSSQEAYLQYKKYAKYMGFGVSIRSSRRSKCTREFIDVKYVCTRHGSKRETNASNPRPCLKIDCKASMHVKRRLDGMWYVEDINTNHNHDLFPSHSHYFPCHRDISSSQKHDISNLHAVGVGANKIFAAMAKQHGGYEKIGCLEKDIRNHLDKERRLALEQGDAKAMLEYFMRMQEEDPNFFYAMDLDDDQQLRNVFWVDGKGREDYNYCGDVVSFDTTYITNKYKMPFAPFIGVNNHFQSTILGCALLADESKSTFVWLMKTWVRAMGGKHPNAIITDQDKAMKAAIKDVFPMARHRHCLWHILRKIPEKIGHIVRKYENFSRVMNRCIYKTWTSHEFERKWSEMVDMFELADNEWIESLFEDRTHWVPTYMKDTFFAGMSTTQRSESINSFFDKYVNKKTTLKEFVEQYKVAVEDREEAEKQADFNTWQKEPVLKSPSPFEIQMSSIYTHEIYKKFQVEVLGAFGCHSVKKNLFENTEEFCVQDFEMREEFIVHWDPNSKEITCLCRSFEYNGFLCRHALSVLHYSGVFNVPSPYILKRWTKCFRNNLTRMGPLPLESKIDRRDKLFEQAILLSDEGSICAKSYDIASRALELALDQCKKANASCSDRNSETIILDPPTSKTKGAPKRIKAGIEKGGKVKRQTKSIKGGKQKSSSIRGHASRDIHINEAIFTSEKSI